MTESKRDRTTIDERDTLLMGLNKVFDIALDHHNNDTQKLFAYKHELIDKV